MSNNEFRRPVSIDTAPRGSLCEWCGKPAEKQLTAIGGSYHNDNQLFYRCCRDERDKLAFCLEVVNAMARSKCCF